MRSAWFVLLAASLVGCSQPQALGTSRSKEVGGCGTCPTGFTCGTANGTSVCFSPTGVPKFTNIVVVMMENTTLATLQTADNTPYLTGLGQAWASSSNYHGATHPSLRNYIALTSGDPQGIGDDDVLHKLFCDCHPTGPACSAFNCVVLGIPLGNCGCPINARNVADDIEAAGLTWRDYGEGMGTPCNLTDNSATNYAARHNPFLYYDDIQTTSRCTSNVVDYSSFASDLQAGLPTFSLVAPNLVHDMHNPFPASSQNYVNGDQWLATQIPSILGAAPWQPGGAGLLVIVWDEDDLSGGLTQSTDDPIPMFLISPLAQAGGYVSATQYNHYSLLATIEDSLGLPRLLNAQAAKPMTDFFVNGGAPAGAPVATTSDASTADGAPIGCASATDCPADEACDLSTMPGTCSAQCTSGACACATDEQCNQPMVVCTNGQCAAATGAAAGATCMVSTDCRSNQCTAGICQCAASGGNCVTDSDCCGGASCSAAGTCEAISGLADGSDCTDPSQCSSNQCNSNETCGCVASGGTCQTYEDCCNGTACSAGMCQ